MVPLLFPTAPWLDARSSSGRILCSLSVLPTLRLASKGALHATKCINQQHLNIWEQGRLCRALLPTSELHWSPMIGGGALEILHAHTHTKKSMKSQIFVLSYCPKEASSRRKQSCPGTKKKKGKGAGRMCPMVPLCRLGSAGSQGFGFLAPVGMSRKCRITLGLEE